MRKNKLLLLVAIITMFFTLVGCNKKTQSDNQNQNTQETVSISSIKIENGNFVITYTNGNIETFPVNSSEKETIEIKIHYVDFTGSLVDSNSYTVIKNELLLPQLTDLFEYVIKDNELDDYNNYITDIYYGSELIDENYVVVDEKELFVFMEQFTMEDVEALTPNVGQLYLSFSFDYQYIEKLEENYIAKVNKETDKTRDIYLSKQIEYLNRMNEEAGKILNNYKDVIKTTLMGNVYELLIYDVETLNKYKENYNTFFEGIDNLSSISMLNEYLKNMSDIINKDIYPILNEENELLKYKNDMISKLQIVLSIIGQNDPDIKTKSAQLIKIFNERIYDIVFCNDLEQLKSLEKSMILDMDYEVHDVFSFSIKQLLLKEELVIQFFNVLKNKDVELYNQFNNAINSGSNLQIAQSYFEMCGNIYAFSYNYYQIMNFAESNDIDLYIHDTLLPESKELYETRKNEYIQNFLYELPFERITDEKFSEFRSGMFDLFNEIRPLLKYDEFKYKKAELIFRLDRLEEYSSNFYNELVLRIEYAQTIEEFVIVENDANLFINFINEYDYISHGGFQEYIMNTRFSDVKTYLSTILGFDQKYHYLQRDINMFNNSIFDFSGYKDYLNSSYISEYMEKAQNIDLDYVKNYINSFLEFNSREVSYVQPAIIKINGMQTLDELKTYLSTFEFSYYSSGLLNEMLEFYTQHNKLLSTLSDYSDQFTEEQKQIYTNSLRIDSANYYYNIGYYEFSLDGSDSSKVHLTEEYHNTIVDNIRDDIDCLTQLLEEVSGSNE